MELSKGNPLTYSLTSDHGSQSNSSDPVGYHLDAEPTRGSRPSKALTFCVFGCLTSMGLRDKVLREMVFFPPEIPGYIIRHDSFNTTEATQRASIKEEKSNKCQAGEKIEPVNINQIIRPSSQMSVTFNWLRTPKKQEIGCLSFIHSYSPKESIPFLIVSHGNATDLGYMVPNLFGLCAKTRCNVLCYEYTGYGQSSGRPSERNTFADIRAAYEFVTKQLAIPTGKIIIYGQSVGSGPSCDLAADPLCPIAGLLLHSPIASGVRIIHENIKKSPFFDCYRNTDKIRKLQCPILIIHGMMDNQVPYRHSEQLFKAATKARRARQEAEGLKKRDSYCAASNVIPDTESNSSAAENVCPASCAAQPLSDSVHINHLSGDNGNVQMLLVEKANHNDLEEVMGAQFYERLRRFFHTITTA